MVTRAAVVERSPARQPRAGREQRLHRAFRQQPGPFVAAHDHAQPLAHEVVGDLRELPIGDRGNVAQQRLVDRIDQAAVQARVAHREREHVGGRPSLAVVRARDVHHAFGERAGLVRAEDIHAAEVLDGGQPLHQHALLGQRRRAAREDDVEDRGQELRAEAHRERDREQQRLHDRAREQHVDGEHGDDKHGHRAGEKDAELAHAPIELRLRRPEAQASRDAAVRGGSPRLDDQDARDSGADVGPHEHGNWCAPRARRPRRPARGASRRGTSRR